MKRKQALYPLLYAATAALRTRRLVERSRQSQLLPVYHTVSDAPLPHLYGLYPVKSARAFECDVDYLLRHFASVGLGELEAAQAQSTPRFHLTFDDGMRDCLEVVAPILERKGVDATFFINPAFVGNATLFHRHQVGLLLHRWRTSRLPRSTRRAVRDLLRASDHWQGSVYRSIYAFRRMHDAQLRAVASLLEVDFEAYLQKNRPYLDLAELQTLRTKGFTIGAHSFDHPKYQQLDLTEQLDQTHWSLDYVRRHFAGQPLTFAFPYSSDEIRLAFFEALPPDVAWTMGTAGLKVDDAPRHLQRLPMEGTPFSPGVMVRGEYAFYLLTRHWGRHHYPRRP